MMDELHTLALVCMIPCLLMLSDVVTGMTTDQVKTSIYNVLAAVGVNTTTWKPGAVARTIIAACSIILAGFSQLIALISGGGFLETSSGPWLTLVAHYVFGVDRQPATNASGKVTLTNTGGGTYTWGVDELIIGNPDTGKQYRNTSSITLGPMSTLTDVPIAAVEAGAASTSTAGTIVSMITTASGVTVTNPDPVVGADEEGDDSLKQRCSAKLGSLSPNGPWDAYSFVAKSATRLDGTTIGVTRVRTTNDTMGNVFVYVATATGPVTGTVGDVSTDLGAISDAIQRKAVPLAVTANVLSATARTIGVTAQVWMYNASGRTVSQVQTEIATKLALYMAKQPVGGNVIAGSGAVYQSDLQAVIDSAFPDDIFRVSISSPALDTAIDPFQVPVLGPVAITVTQLPSAGGGV